MTYSITVPIKWTAASDAWSIVAQQDRISTDIPLLNNKYLPCKTSGFDIDISTAYIRSRHASLGNTEIWHKIQRTCESEDIMLLCPELRDDDGNVYITFQWVKCTRPLSEYNPPTDDLSDACSPLLPEQLDIDSIAQTILWTYGFVKNSSWHFEKQETMSLEMPTRPHWAAAAISFM